MKAKEITLNLTRNLGNYETARMAVTYEINEGDDVVDSFKSAQLEINEAFAAVAMIAMRDLGISHDKINVNGGATALGHPIGASGARIIATLVAALKARGLTKGVASLCIGGGEATAVAIEIIQEENA